MIDAITRLPYADITLRECPHPAVQQRYGKDCRVSVYTCKKCQFGQRQKLFDGWGCGYAKE